MGAVGADFATQKAGGAVLGTYGFLGRRTVGDAMHRGANAIVKSERWKGTAVGQFAYERLTAGTNASFSPRGLATTLGKSAHLDFGKPNKTAAHGFHGIAEEKRKSIEEYEKKIELTTEGQGVWKEKEEELKEHRNTRREYVQESLDAVQEQRLVVEKARLGNNKEALKLARAELDRRLYDFAVKNGDAEKIGPDGKTKVPVDPRGGALKKREEELDKQFKAWKGRADADKRENYAAGIEHAFEIMGPFSPEAHAKHEAAINIRKNGGKSKMDKAFDDLKKGMKDEGDGEAPATAPPPPPEH